MQFADASFEFRRDCIDFACEFAHSAVERRRVAVEFIFKLVLNADEFFVRIAFH